MSRLLSIVGLVAMGVAIISTMMPDRKWAAFAAEHHCQLVGETESSLTPGISSGGRIYMSRREGRQTFNCDDGIRYTRGK